MMKEGSVSMVRYWTVEDLQKEIVNLYALYVGSDYGRRYGWKTGEGALTLTYPDFFHYELGVLPQPKVEICSSVFGEDSRVMIFDSITDAILWLRGKREELLDEIGAYGGKPEWGLSSHP